LGLLWAWKQYPSKKIQGKKIRNACHGLCRRSWQFFARSGVSSVLATSSETLGTLPIKKNQGEKIATPATASAGIRGIPSPVPVRRA
jgi:hypothetical protein